MTAQSWQTIYSLAGVGICVSVRLRALWLWGLGSVLICGRRQGGLYCVRWHAAPSVSLPDHSDSCVAVSSCPFFCYWLHIKCSIVMQQIWHALIQGAHGTCMCAGISSVSMARVCIAARLAGWPVCVLTRQRPWGYVAVCNISCTSGC